MKILCQNQKRYYAVFWQLYRVARSYFLQSLGFSASMAITGSERVHLKWLSSYRCSPEGLFQKNVTPSWLGLFSACVLLAFLHVEHHNANTLRRSCKNWEPALSLALFCHTHSASVPRWLYGCSLLDVSPLLNIPSPLPPSSLPSFLPFSPCHLLSDVASRSTGLAVTLDFKAPPHSSVSHQKERAIQQRSKREGGYKSWVYKKREGTSVWKEDMREKEDPLLTAGNLEPQMQKRGMQLWIHTGRVTLLFFCPLRCVQIPPSWSLSHFPCLLAHLSFIPFTWAISTKGGQGLFLPVIHHSTCVFVCVCVCSHSPVFLNLIPRIFIAFVLPDILPLLCILGWLASPFSGHWESPLLPFPAGALFTLNYTSTCTPSQTCIVFVFIFVCVWMGSTFGCMALYVNASLVQTHPALSVRLLFFPPYYCFSASDFSACMQGFKFKLWCLQITWNT